MDSIRPPKLPLRDQVPPQPNPSEHLKVTRPQIPSGAEGSSKSAYKPTLQITKETPLYTQRKKIAWKKWLRVILIAMSLLMVGFALFYGLHVVKALNAIQLKSTDSPSFFSQIGTLSKTLYQDPFETLKKTSDGRINILLLGRAGKDYPGQNLTDTIILMSIDGEKRKVALLSLPRDLYIVLPEEHLAGKINSLYQYGLSQNQGTALIEKAVTTVTGQPLHYTFILDFDGFEKIIDTFGGVELEVARDIYDERYPGKNYSYETFELNKGWQKLDGKTTLKYVRERHDDPEGDFGRAKRQQQVLIALRDKVLMNSLLFNMNAVNDLLTILGESVKTNATLSEMESFLSLAKKVDTENIESVVIDAWKKESLLRVSHVELGGVRAFTLMPRTGNWQEIREVSQSIFSREEMLRRKAELEKEAASVAILYRPDDYRQAEQIQSVLEEDYKEVQLTRISSYRDWPESNLLLDQSDQSKQWSLDTLLKKLSLEKTASLPFDANSHDQDFIIILGKNAETSLPDDLSFQKDDLSDTKEGDPLIIENTDTKL